MVMSYDNYESSRHSGSPIKLFLFKGTQNIGHFAFCDGETPFTRDGITYQPWPIKHDDINNSGNLDKADLTVTLALGTDLDALFVAYPSSQVINLTIFEGQIGDVNIPANYPAIWVGRTGGANFNGNELEITCDPVSTSIRRPGLRRMYQIGCPHVLYGDQCQANKAAATSSRIASAISGRNISLSVALPVPVERFVGGLIEWDDPATGWHEMRTIVKINPAGTMVTIRGIPKGLSITQTVTVARGCDRQMTGCNQHSNIFNYGGQPFIPLENPLSQKNQFY